MKPLPPHHFQQNIQLNRIEPEIFGDGNVGFKPELSFVAASLHVYMDWLRGVAFIREEKESVALAPKNGRHEDLSKKVANDDRMIHHDTGYNNRI